MNRVNIDENKEFLTIEIQVRDSQHWILPMLLFLVPGFCCGLVLIYLIFMALLKNIDVPIILLILGVFLFVAGVFGIIHWLFNTFGKENLVFNNRKKLFNYRKELFNIGKTKKFDYQFISSFIASDSLLPYQNMRRTDIWARCEFNYKGKKFRFGYLRTLEDAKKITDRINQYMRNGI